MLVSALTNADEAKLRDQLSSSYLPDAASAPVRALRILEMAYQTGVDGLHTKSSGASLSALAKHRDYDRGRG